MRAVITILLTALVTSCAASMTPADSQGPDIRLDATRWKASTAPGAGTEPAAPLVLLDSTYVRPAGPTITVTGGPSAARDLQAAIDRATPGSIIELKAGATFTGNFTLPQKSPSRGTRETDGSDWIVIRSSASDSDLPRPGTRVSPSFAAVLPRLVTSNGDPVVGTVPGAHHFRFIGVEFATAPGTKVNTLVRLGSADQTDASMFPHHIVFDRCFIHGNARDTLRRGIALNSAATAIVDSYISDCHELGADSQAICGWNGPGPYKIVNNYVEAAGENLMFGGADAKVADLVPSDIEIRRNHFRKPLSWKAGSQEYGGVKWSVKNLLELKNAQRVVIEANVFENVWVEAQTGYAILFKSVNQDGSAPWSVTQDVEFKNNTVRHCSGALNIQGRADDQPGSRTKRIRIRNNLFEDVGGASFEGEGCFLKVTDCEALTVDHNTVTQSGNIITAYGPPSPGFVFTNNLVRHNAYGVKGDGTAPGIDTLVKYFPACVFKRNIIIGSPAARYPGDNFLLATIDKVGFAADSKTSYRFGQGSPYRNGATDGSGIGCDIEAVAGALPGSPD